MAGTESSSPTNRKYGRSRYEPRHEIHLDRLDVHSHSGAGGLLQTARSHPAFCGHRSGARCAHPDLGSVVAFGFRRGKCSPNACWRRASVGASRDAKGLISGSRSLCGKRTLIPDSLPTAPISSSYQPPLQSSDQNDSAEHRWAVYGDKASTRRVCGKPLPLLKVSVRSAPS